MPIPAFELVLALLAGVVGVLVLLLLVRAQAISGELAQLADLRTRFDAQYLAAERLERALREEIARSRTEAGAAMRETIDKLQSEFGSLREGVTQTLGDAREIQLARLKELDQSVQSKQDALRKDILEQMLVKLAEQARAEQELLQATLRNITQQLGERAETMTKTVSERLEQISGKVNERLEEGFKKTNETFTSVMTRLAVIDDAQKKIEGLTTNVVSLQELLGDKRSRGAFGEVQLEALVRNLLPPTAYAFQYALVAGARERVDCALFLPEPTGTVAVDSKFPLENYHRGFNTDLAPMERDAAQREFGRDVRKHVDAISEKYIVPGVTSDGAVMFVPAEAVFAEIHAYHSDVVDYAQAKRVWIVSPTTLMAILNTARAVLKDVETRRQIHVIQEALKSLAVEFERFDDRMQRLATHIRQAHEDAQLVQTTSQKISKQFQRIEQAELDEPAQPASLPPPPPA